MIIPSLPFPADPTMALFHPARPVTMVRLISKSRPMKLKDGSFGSYTVQEIEGERSLGVPPLEPRC